MTNFVKPDAILGKLITRIVSHREVGSNGFVNARCFVEVENSWLELDSCGVDGPEDLNWTKLPLGHVEEKFPELIGRKITHVVVSDYLPTLALVLSNEELLYCSDLGPPFNAFGPLHQCLGNQYTKLDLVDFWTRTPVVVH